MVGQIIIQRFISGFGATKTTKVQEIPSQFEKYIPEEFKFKSA